MSVVSACPAVFFRVIVVRSFFHTKNGRAVINNSKKAEMVNEKYQKLKEILTGMGSVLVAFSGGSDSSLVLKVAHDALGDKAVAMTAVSASLPASERFEAVQVARQIGARQGGRR